MVVGSSTKLQTVAHWENASICISLNLNDGLVTHFVGKSGNLKMVCVGGGRGGGASIKKISCGSGQEDQISLPLQGGDRL